MFRKTETDLLEMAREIKKEGNIELMNFAK